MEENLKYEHETEVNLSRLLLHICLKWRSILLIALLCALAAGGFQLLSGVLSLADRTGLEELKAQAELSASLREAEEKQYTFSIEEYTRLLQAQKDYNANSLLMQIDPYNEWTGTVNLYVNASDESLACRIASVYCDHARSDAFCQELLGKISFQTADAKYLKELFSASVDGNACAAVIQVTADTQSHCQELLELAENLLTQQCKEISRTAGSHTVEAQSAPPCSRISSGLSEHQSLQRDKVALLENNLASAQNNYLKWKKEANASKIQVPTMPRILRGAVKLALITGAGAAVLLCVLFCISYLLSDKIQRPEDFPSNLLLLGELPRRSGKRIHPFDRLFCHLFGVTVKRSEYDSRLEAGALCIERLAKPLSEGGSRTIAFVSDIPSEELQSLVKALDKLSSPQCPFVAAGNILVSPEAGKLAASSAAVVLVGKQGVSAKNTLESMLLQIRAGERPLLGALLTDVDAK